MAISNCLLSPTSESLADFQFGAYLKSIILNYATTHSRDVVINIGTVKGHPLQS
jgi:hypothetical protein